MNPVVESYENYREEDRLTTNNSRKIEFITTIKALDESFPPKGKILDCAAGTGVYSFYLAEKGYSVTATDITPRHIQYINNKLKTNPCDISAAVLDATDLSRYQDETFDAVLCMGPFYHLTAQEQREKCLSECLRVLRKGGLLATAYISRFFVFPYVATSDVKYLNTDLSKTLLDTGVLKHDDPNCFWTDTYYATPEEMVQLYHHYHLQLIDHFAQDGISPMLKDKIDLLSESQFKIWCDYHYSICREKSIVGASNHVMIIGRK